MAYNTKCKHVLDPKFDMPSDPFDYQDENNLCYYYGKCIYCIMEGTKWFEEYDCWGEVATRIVDIVKAGFNDYKRGLRDFLDSYTLPTKCNHPSCRCCSGHNRDWCFEIERNIKPFINFYNIGIELAKNCQCDNFPENIYD